MLVGPAWQVVMRMVPDVGPMLDLESFDPADAVPRHLQRGLHAADIWLSICYRLQPASARLASRVSACQSYSAVAWNVQRLTFSRPGLQHLLALV